MRIEHLKGSYEVLVARGASQRIEEHWPLDDYSSIAVVTTEALWELFGPLPGTPIFVPDGERAKEPEVLQSLWRALFDHQLDTHSLVIALGGGSVGDVAGFAAATFMRGIDLLHVPTTLVGMVDSAIGGKTAVNFCGVKNAVGSMHHPVMVLVDPDFLETLPQREFASGMAEVIKHGVISDVKLFEQLEQGPPDDIEAMVQRAAAVKVQVVNDGVRDHLNYGHTFGHALESLSDYAMVHGEGVSMGMSCAARLAALLGRVDGELVDRQDRVCKAAGLPTELPEFSTSDIIAAMRRDKKSIDSQLRLVIPDQIGRVSVVEEIPESLLVAAIEGSTLIL